MIEVLFVLVMLVCFFIGVLAGALISARRLRMENETTTSAVFRILFGGGPGSRTR